MKFQAEMVEIIEAEVGNPHLEIFILLLHLGRKKYLSYRCHLRPQLSQPFLHGFSKFLWLSCSKFPGFLKTSPTFTFRMSFVQEKCQKQSVDGLMGHPVLSLFIYSPSSLSNIAGLNENDDNWNEMFSLCATVS